MEMLVIFSVFLLSPVVSANFHKFATLPGTKVDNASWSEARAADNDLECVLLCDSSPNCVAASTANGSCQLVGQGLLEVTPSHGWKSYFQTLTGRMNTTLVATQSAMHYRDTCPECGWAHCAIDGITDGRFLYSKSCTQTEADAEANIWWKVDFHGVYLVSGVVIWNRQGAHSDRLRGLRVYVAVSESRLGDKGTVCGAYEGPPSSDADNPVRVSCEKALVGRFLKIHKIAPIRAALHLCEVEIV